MTQFIDTLKNKYESFTPKQKATLDFVGFFVSCFLGVGFILLADHFNLVMELAIFFISYFIFQLLKTLYNFRVAYYTTLDKLNKKG